MDGPIVGRGGREATHLVVQVGRQVGVLEQGAAGRTHQVRQVRQGAAPVKVLTYKREYVIDVSIPPETLYHRDDALLYIAYVILIWAASIPANRWHCSLWP